MDRPNRTRKITISLVLSILSFLISLSTFAYNIYKDNKEAVALSCFEYCCVSDNNNGYIVSGTYIINNFSHKNISIIDIYFTYNGTKLNSYLNASSIIPIKLNAGESYKISLDPQYASYRFDPQLFELHVISSAQKKYSVKSTYF